MSTKYDPEIMAELLQESGVRENVAQMAPAEVEMFKQLLVTQGTYKRYVWERQKRQMKELVKG